MRAGAFAGLVRGRGRLPLLVAAAGLHNTSTTSPSPSASRSCATWAAFSARGQATVAMLKLVVQAEEDVARGRLVPHASVAARVRRGRR